MVQYGKFTPSKNIPNPHQISVDHQVPCFAKGLALLCQKFNHPSWHLYKEFATLPSVQLETHQGHLTGLLPNQPQLRGQIQHQSPTNKQHPAQKILESGPRIGRQDSVAKWTCRLELAGEAGLVGSKEALGGTENAPRQTGFSSFCEISPAGQLARQSRFLCWSSDASGVWFGSFQPHV